MSTFQTSDNVVLDEEDLRILVTYQGDILCKVLNDFIGTLKNPDVNYELFQESFIRRLNTYHVLRTVLFQQYPTTGDI